MHHDIPSTDPAGAARLIQQGYQLLDVRTQEEWDESHVDGALHIPLDQLPGRVAEVGNQAVVICRSGGRSATATAVLIDSGRAAINLDGGIIAWAEQGHPVV